MDRAVGPTEEPRCPVLMNGWFGVAFHSSFISLLFLPTRPGFSPAIHCAEPALFASFDPPRLLFFIDIVEE